MKKLLLLIVLCPFLILAQDYIPMLQDGNEWSLDVFYCPLDPPNNPTWTETEQISLGEEVDINGVLYKQVYRDGEPSCLLREENGIVYKRFSNNEKVFFDFNMEIGETVNIGSSGFEGDYCMGLSHNLNIFIIKVNEIETQFIAGKDRKVIKFVDSLFPEDGEVMQWIEGIGTKAGMAYPWPFQDFTCGSALACFSNNGETYFMNGADSCDNTSLGIGDISEEQITLYPNPITNSSILQLPSEGIVDTLKIFDMNGKVVKEQLVTKDYVRLNVMEYASGLYFYQVLSEDRILKTAQFLVK